MKITYYVGIPKLIDIIYSSENYYNNIIKITI